MQVPSPKFLEFNENEHYTDKIIQKQGELQISLSVIATKEKNEDQSYVLRQYYQNFDAFQILLDHRTMNDPLLFQKKIQKFILQTNSFFTGNFTKLNFFSSLYFIAIKVKPQFHSCNIVQMDFSAPHQLRIREYNFAYHTREELLMTIENVIK